MRFPLSLRIAGRYLRGRGSVNAVPLLSRISMLAIAVGSAAMIILFSVFNGFEVLIQDLYKAFYPDVRLTPVTGKFFSPAPGLLDSIAHLHGITAIAPVLEDHALAMNDEEQVIVSLRGVDSHYFSVNNLKAFIKEGVDSFTEGDVPASLVGLGIASRLGLDPQNDFSRLHLYYPNSKTGNLALNPADAFGSLELRTGGVFSVQSDFDAQYVLAPLADVQHLFREEGKLSSIEIKAAPGTDLQELKKSIASIAGKSFLTETRYEQNHTLYGVMRTEKWATYIILLFVLLIASVNMIGALALLVLEKGRDAAILRAMGARRNAIRRIFLAEGMLWAVIGGGIGLIMGWIVCAAQQYWGFVKLGAGFMVDAYPVAMQWQDFALVLCTVLVVGGIAAIYPALKAGKDGVQTGMR